MEQNQEKITWPQFLANIPARTHGQVLSGIYGSAGAFALSQMYKAHRLPMLVMLASLKEAGQLGDELAFFLRGIHPSIFLFPPYNLSPYQSMAYHSETAAKRMKALYQLAQSPTPPLVVTTPGACMQRLIPRDKLCGFAELLMRDEEIDREKFIAKLTAGGYSRTVMVEEPGDFSVRGGILDLFTPLYDDPLRIEFFGDLVESIRLFSPDTQRTHDSLDEAVVLPAKEAILQPSEINRFVGHVRSLAAELEMPVTQVREVVQRIKDQEGFSGLENLLPLIYQPLGTLFDYLPDTSLAVLVEPGDLERSAQEVTLQTQQAYQLSIEKRKLCLPPERLFLNWSDVQTHVEPFKPLIVKSLLISPSTTQSDDIAVCHAQVTDTEELIQSLKSAAQTDTPFAPLIHWLKEGRQAGCTTLIACRRPSHMDRLAQSLEPYELFPVPITSMSEILEGRGRFYLIEGGVSQGFRWPSAEMAVINDEEIFGIRYKPRKSAIRTKVSELLNIEDLKQDDLVVHDEQGIGRYEGLVKLTIDRSTNDYLLIVYRDDDRLYLPVERMNLVHKYMGTEGVKPVLDKMGGITWEKVKKSVKRSAEKIAGQLLKLYAARKVQKGHAFGAVDTYFRDFEDGFPFEETPDQAKAIEDVLNDMRQPTPMDRLVCGDVGYGKTEVALRASFLAVSEARQVALLVPTTVLAEQHYATFCERFKNYPVRIAALSRFRPLKEQRAIITGLKEGTIDIAIGTHRLLQKDVEFNNLGLLVLDEEQRFGVRHKEKIKRLRKTVDVLTLTATPIPRTLHFSLMGIRDISLISTPPEQRRSITTYITEFEDALVADAVRKELKRKGQIFFVHNRILGLDALARRIKKVVPEVRLAIAHGRMAEDQLEAVMLDFMQKRIDMLVCTTIVESGLDVTSANTIFINRADLFGLSQIYQLRGRVGRGDEQAYAYLFIPHEAVLGKDAQKRLKVLMEYSDLGSGFQIAMSDLKIRGGGTMLGASQSGHIASVGYDMFLKLMESAIADIKGEPIVEELEPEINLPLSTFLPENYISDIDQRLSLYRRLARMDDLKAIAALKGEMVDRFGKLPPEANNLLLKIMLKVLAVRAGCKRLDLNDTLLQLQFSETHQQQPMGIIEMVNQSKDLYQWTPDQNLKIRLTAGTPNVLVSQTKNILIEIARRVNQ